MWRLTRTTGVEFVLRAAHSLSHACCFILIIFALAGPKATAAEMSWQEAIKSSGCLASSPTPEQWLLIVSAWEGKTVVTLLEQAGLFDIKQAMKDEKFFYEGPLQRKLQPVIGRLLASARNGLAQFNADMAEKHAAMCSIVKYQASGNFEDVVRSQMDVGLQRQPYLAVAQFILRLHGCRIDSAYQSPSGIFGKESQASWQLLAKTASTSIRSIVPTPSQTAMLAGGPYYPGICRGDGQKNTNAGSIAAFVRLFSTFRFADCDNPKAKSDVNAVTKAVSADERLADGLPDMTCVRGRNIVDGFFSDARSNPSNIRGFVRAYLGVHRFVRPDGATQGGSISAGWQSETLVPVHYQVSLEYLPDHLWFTAFIANTPVAIEAVLELANQNGLAAFGTILTEGLSDAGKNIELGVKFFEAAAKAGSDFALLRAAQAYEQGYGVAANPARSIEYYRQLAQRDQPAGFLALARIHEDGELIPSDLKASAIWYTRLLGSVAKQPSGSEKNTVVDGVAKAIQGRLVAGSAYLSSKDGLGLLDSSANTSPALAAALGDLFTCADCGGIVNIELAAKWYRKALASGAEIDSGKASGDEAAVDDHAYRFARLLIAKPQLAQTPEEATKIVVDASNRGKVKSSLLRFYLEAIRDRPDQATLEDRLAKKMTSASCDAAGTSSGGDAFNVDCIQFAHLLAIGALDKRLVAFGYRYLSIASEQAAGDSDRRENAIKAFIDILAYYGDFDAARNLLLRSKITNLGSSGFTARTAVIARLLAQQPTQKTPRLSGLRDFIQAAIAKGQGDARIFLEIIQSNVKPVAQKPDVAQSSRYEAAYRQQIARGGVSTGLVSATRQFSQVEYEAKHVKRAVELELAALNAELYLQDVSVVFNGPLPGALARVCLYAKSSRRVSEIGDPNVALLLAKTAVNELQAVRKDVRNLPQELQLCFADLVSNHYRWLADLLLRQDRKAEAVRVLDFLKDFETYDFLDKDERFQGSAFDTLPLSTTEANSQSRLSSIVVPAAELGMRERVLLVRQRQLLASNQSLPEMERLELSQVRSQIAAQEAKTAGLLEEIRVALKASEDASQSLPFDPSTVRGRLRNEYDGKAVAIHFVVLPDRMSAILTLPQGAPVSYTLDKLDGAAFSEEALNRKIIEFRTALQKRSRDPGPMAQGFYQLLLAPFQKEIEVVKPTTILIKSDRKLALLPFAALHDGKKYLAQTFGIVKLTGAPPPQRRPLADATISAFGVTKAFPGFPELPNVRSELHELVRSNSGSGLFWGQEYLDQKFTRQALASGLVFGTAAKSKLGMVHIASHFKLGANGSDSFLLLGNGDRLTITDMLRNLGASREFDFGDVDLLTLSACETAYVEPRADGRALESFAAATQKNGVRSVIGTLWPIADQSTPAMMRQFYSLSMKPHISRDIALATAQQSLINSAQTAPLAGNLMTDFSHPYYWAPFVLLQGMQ
jgi:CHAT domain-containing protein